MIQRVLLSLILFMSFSATAEEINYPSTLKKLQEVIKHPLSGVKTIQKGVEQNEALFSFSQTPDLFIIMDKAHASIKQLIIAPALALDAQIPTLNVVFSYLFSFYILCIFMVSYLLQRYAPQLRQSILVQTFLVLTLLLINTIFYGLGEEYVTDLELQKALTILIFLFTFMTVNRLIISFILSEPYNFFKPIQEKHTLRKTYNLHLISELNLIESLIKYALPLLVLILQGADYVQFCLNISQNCSDSLQYLVLLVLKALFISYLIIFYLSIYSEPLKLTDFQKRLWLGVLIIGTIFFAWNIPSLIGINGESLRMFFLDAFIVLFPFLNLPIYKLIASKIHIKQKKGDIQKTINIEKLSQDITKYLFLIISIVISLRLLVIFNDFNESTKWFKTLSNYIYMRFISLAFVSFISLGLYYKIISEVKKFSSLYTNRLESNFYTVKSNYKLVAISQSIGDIGPFIFWPIFSYIILVEFGFNQIYLISFYGIVVASTLIGGRESIGDLLKGASFVFQGLIIRGGKVTINDSLYGIIEKISLQNFYLRDEKGLLHVMNYSNISTITFHNEVYTNFSLEVSEEYNIRELDALLEETKNDFNKENTENIELLTVFKVEKIEGDRIRIKYLMKAEPIKVWRLQTAFEAKLGQALKKKKISYKLIEDAPPEIN